MKIVGIIPARYASTRFPGKPLALIAGKPLIQHVVEQCQKADVVERSHRGHGRHPHLGGGAEFLPRGNDRARTIRAASDRIAEVAGRCQCDAVVNIQGDEPLIDPAVIDAVAGALERDEMSTAATRDPQRRGTTTIRTS